MFKNPILTINQLLIYDTLTNKLLHLRNMDGLSYKNQKLMLWEFGLVPLGGPFSSMDLPMIIVGPIIVLCILGMWFNNIL